MTSLSSRSNFSIAQTGLNVIEMLQRLDRFHAYHKPSDRALIAMGGVVLGSVEMPNYYKGSDEFPKVHWQFPDKSVLVVGAKACMVRPKYQVNHGVKP